MCKIFLEWSVNIVPPNNKLYLCFRTVSKPWEQNIDRRFDFCLLERLMTSLCWLPFDTTDNSDQKKPICAKTWIYGELQVLRCHPTIVPHHYQFSYCMRVCCLPRQSSSVTTLGSSLSALVIQYFLANSFTLRKEIFYLNHSCHRACLLLLVLIVYKRCCSF